MLINLTQGWGVGALASALCGRADAWERPAVLAKRLRPDFTRFVLADGVGRALERLGPLHRLLHWTLTRALRLHGRVKDQRRR